jgi:hypothetical protein
MKKSLADILRESLIGKKIKLYKILDKQYNPKGNVYFLTDKDNIPVSKKVEIIEETYGVITNLETDEVDYEGDYYDFTIVDGDGTPIYVNGLSSITSKIEFLN